MEYLTDGRREVLVSAQNTAGGAGVSNSSFENRFRMTGGEGSGAVFGFRFLDFAFLKVCLSESVIAQHESSLQLPSLDGAFCSVADSQES